MKDGVAPESRQHAQLGPGGGATIFQVTTAYRDPNNDFDPGGRLGQVSLRLNW